MTRHALLFGATGLVGSHLLERLLADDGFRVTAVTRRPLALAHSRLANPVADFATRDGTEGLADVDVAFCCLGTTIRQAGSREAFHAIDHDLVLRCAAAAKRCGARHFIAVSAVGISRRSPVFYNRVKAETEADLEALGFAQLTLMQPSLLLGDRGGPTRIGEEIGIRLSGLFTPLLVGGLSIYTPVQAADVAAAMLARARAPSGARVERLRYRDMQSLAH